MKCAFASAGAAAHDFPVYSGVLAHPPMSPSMVALSSLNILTIHSSDAAKRAAKSTEQSRVAAMNAMIAAREASGNPALLAVVESAVTASVAAALAAVESAAAAAA